jgi:hypothetical protein
MHARSALQTQAVNCSDRTAGMRSGCTKNEAASKKKTRLRLRKWDSSPAGSLLKNMARELAECKAGTTTARPSFFSGA